MDKLSLKDLTLNGKKVLMRVDFNVPLDNDLNIIDPTRIEASLPSIKYVLSQNASLILMSHLGRPKHAPNPDLSLKPCAHLLTQVLNIPVKMAPDCVGHVVEKMAEELKPGEILLLENLRFHRAEEHPEEDPSFAEKLSKLADIFVNDAFGSSHRIHSSTCTVAKHFPQKAAAGFLLEKETNVLLELLTKPKRPFYALIGGAKISTKVGVIKALIEKVDCIMIGGAMAYTFFQADGISIGASKVEKDLIPVAKEIVSLCKQKGVEFILPDDLVVADQLSDDARIEIISVQDGIPSNFEGVDIGPKTVEKFRQILQKAQTLLWNGPLGVYELESFAKGTQSVAKIVAESKFVSVVGGGDTIAAINEFDLASQITHISTGGGATLEFIEWGTLPGIDVLSNKVAARA